jgi:glycosyl transferase family 2
MISIVVPTLGRPSLAALLAALADQVAAGPDLEILLVDDRRDGHDEIRVPATLARYTKVLTGRGTGPAAARNIGWRAARHPWVAFLDDDVLPRPDWLCRLAKDLDVPGDVGGVQGNVRVPLPDGRRPTDWERVTAGLATGRWITADMAYRRSALAEVGGFDERFPRAYREDAELAYRVRRAGWRLDRGDRVVVHPVRRESAWVSLRTQRGNADDALLRRLYGHDWRAELDLPPGRRSLHAAVTACGAIALAAAAGAATRAAGTRRSRAGAVGSQRLLAGVAAVAAACWLAGTADFARARIAPGPRTANEVAVMTATSALIPALAVAHWLRGWWRFRGAVEPTMRSLRQEETVCASR